MLSVCRYCKELNDLADVFDQALVILEHINSGGCYSCKADLSELMKVMASSIGELSYKMDERNGIISYIH